MLTRKLYDSTILQRLLLQVPRDKINAPEPTASEIKHVFLIRQ